MGTEHYPTALPRRDKARNHPHDSGPYGGVSDGD
ncbi:hypothetical protein MICRO11B_200091 [Micrococcus luteus]|nr:hypothetical protein MICRO11B_200091 [Micrococcus luteus]